MRSCGAGPSWREDAEELIASGAVLVDGLRATNPRTLVAADASVRVANGEPGLRGRVKLSAALGGFGIDARDAVALDAGRVGRRVRAGAARGRRAPRLRGRGGLRPAPRLAGARTTRVVILERTNVGALDARARPRPARPRLARRRLPAAGQRPCPQLEARRVRARRAARRPRQAEGRARARDAARGRRRGGRARRSRRRARGSRRRAGRSSRRCARRSAAHAERSRRFVHARRARATRRRRRARAPR